MYMNDIKICTKSINQLKSLLEKIEEKSNSIELKFNIKKCATISIKKGKLTKTRDIWQRQLEYQ